MDNKKILAICTGHQNNDAKVEHLKNLLSRIKKDGVDVCYCTHTPYRIDEISDLVKFVYYDSDNKFPTEQELVDSLSDIDENKITGTYHFFRTLGGRQYKKFFWESHNRSALSNFKNGVSIACQLGYEWITFFDYDIMIPPKNLSEYLEDSIELLESQGLNGLFYMCDGPRTGYIWPMLYVCRPQIFSEHPDFSNPWQRSSKDYYINFGNICFEEIITRIANSRGGVIHYRLDELAGNLNYDASCISNYFTVFNVVDQVNEEKKDNLKFLDFISFDAYLFNNEGLFNMDILLNVEKVHPEFKSFLLEVYIDDKKITSVSDLPVNSEGYWHTQRVLSNLDHKDNESSINFFMKMETTDGIFPHNYSIRIKDFPKYYQIKRIESTI